jgi:putative sigma-54 modulation protein
MEFNITARHVKLTPAIADYVQKKLEKAKRYFDHLIWTQVILDVEKNRHIAEIVIHATGHTFTAKEESTDLYAAIDLASDKIDEQLKRFKERRRSRRTERGTKSRGDAWAHLPPVLPEAPDPRISSMRVLRLAELSLPEAIRTMEQSDSAHWIFLNRETDRVTVVYRKPDKTFGVVESITERIRS